MITKDMTIAQVLQSNKELAAVFMSYGMHCFGCPRASGETVEQAAASHGVDLDEMLGKLNGAK